jgi:hypothetical protein
MSRQFAAALCMTLTLLYAASALAAESDTRLTVRTLPEGAEVWLDNKYIGDSPVVERRLAPGRYTVRVISPLEQVSEVEEVYLQEGQHLVVEKTIRRKYGSLHLSTEPAGATVSVGTTLGETPVANDHMNPGRYRLNISHPRRSYVPQTQDILIPQGDTVRLDLRLERRTPFTTKALVRLALGAGAVAGFVWAVIEQGDYSRELEKYNTTGDSSARESSESAAVRRTLGLVIGGACVLGFEIVAFF